MKKEFKTYDKIVLDKLRAIQPATMKQWAAALGYDNVQSVYHNIRKNRDKLKRSNTRPYKYSVVEVKK